MRRTLKVIVMVILVITALPSLAQQFQWSAGTPITEWTDASGIFSHIDASRSALLGSWFSTSGQLPILVNNFQYQAYGDFPGIQNIRRVVLSPDSGLTQWIATLIPGKGWQVVLPMGPYTRTITVMEEREVVKRGLLGKYTTTEKVPVEKLVNEPGLVPGGYGLEWGVESVDKHNKITLLIIPINWSSERRQAAANHIMVQQATIDFDRLNNRAKVAYLRERGFVEAWDEPSSAVIASQQSQPQPASVQPTEQPAKTDGTVRREVTAKTVNQSTRPTTIQIKCGSQIQVWKNVQVDITQFSSGRQIEFRRAGQVVMVAEATYFSQSSLLELRVVAGNLPAAGDQMFLKEESR